MRSGITTGLFLFAFLIHSTAQDLQRRAFMGIRMEPVTEDVQRVMKLPAIKGVLIQQVISGSTAEAAGLQRGDVLLELDGREVNSPDEAVRAVGTYRAGQTLQYKLFRSGKIMVQQTTIQGVPAETYPDLEVTYSSVKAGDAHLRTMLTKPKHRSGKLPALLFIQGIGCYSMDTPFDTLRPETQLINAIARQGFVVMRVDKSGLGDSRGAPCESIDFFTELEGYRKAYAALQASAEVDSSNCFLFGHSMGGLMAPMLAKDFHVKGIVAYGTIGVNFMEYFTNTRRTIAQALELDAAESDTYVKRECACAAMLLSARLSREEAVKLDEVCGGVYDILLLRSEAYWRQLYDLNIPALWQAYQGKTLAAWGSTDYISARREHELIAETVNKSHPGNGTFLEIPNSNHGMHLASTFSEARTNPGPFNPKVTEMVSEWLKKQLIWKMPESVIPEKENVQEVLWMEGIENAYPRLSQDGSKILFQSNRSGKWQLYLMDTNGSNVQQLTRGDHNNNFPDWSADNRKIAFVSDRDGNEEIYVMDRDGGNLTRLTNHPDRDIHPYFAPDGKTLLFNSSRDNRESFEIYQTDLKAKNQKRITQTPEVETCARFSPDGEKILYLKGFPDGSDDIFVMNPDGSNPVNLTQTPQMEGWPAWSPDGRKIIFSSRRNGAYRLYEMNADGSNVRQVSFAESPKYDARPGYADSGNQIVFNRQMDRTIGIYLLNRFSNNQTNHD